MEGCVVTALSSTSSLWIPAMLMASTVWVIRRGKWRGGGGGGEEWGGREGGRGGEKSGVGGKGGGGEEWGGREGGGGMRW